MLHLPGPEAISRYAFGRLVLEVVYAAYEAAATGARAPLPYDGPRDLTPHEIWPLPTYREMLFIK